MLGWDAVLGVGRSGRIGRPDGSGEAGGWTRFPESGWLSGSAGDLAELVRLVSVPQEAVDSAADALQNGIEGAVAALDEMGMSRPGLHTR